MAQQDPFYLIKQELSDSVTGLQQKMSRFHGLTSANPERKVLAAAVQAGCDDIAWQVRELEGAVERASENPSRFNLTIEELGSRRRWTTATNKQVEGMRETLRTAMAPAPTPESRAVASNEKFMGGQFQSQQQVMKQQDEDLTDIEEAVVRIGRVGRQIGEELEDQGRLIDELDSDVDTTTSRLKAAQKKIADIIRKSGNTKQLLIIGILIVVLIILSVFVFY
ncbi:MAG: hypothetical protein WDW36_007550 [Sanguina aurantia]